MEITFDQHTRKCSYRNPSMNSLICLTTSKDDSTIQRLGLTICYYSSTHKKQKAYANIIALTASTSLPPLPQLSPFQFPYQLSPPQIPSTAEMLWLPNSAWLQVKRHVGLSWTPRQPQRSVCFLLLQQLGRVWSYLWRIQSEIANKKFNS